MSIRVRPLRAVEICDGSHQQHIQADGSECSIDDMCDLCRWHASREVDLVSEGDLCSAPLIYDYSCDVGAWDMWP